MRLTSDNLVQNRLADETNILEGIGNEEVDEVFSVKIRGRNKKLCEECVELAQEEAEIEEGAESAMRDMMGYKGKW